MCIKKIDAQTETGRAIRFKYVRNIKTVFYQLQASYELKYTI